MSNSTSTSTSATPIVKTGPVVAPVPVTLPPTPVLANYANPTGYGGILSANVNVAGVNFGEMGNVYQAVPYAQAVALAEQLEAADPLGRPFTVNGYSDVGWYALLKPAPLEPTDEMPLDTPGFWQVVASGINPGWLAAPYLASQFVAGNSNGYWTGTRLSPVNFPYTVQFQWHVGTPPK